MHFQKILFAILIIAAIARADDPVDKEQGSNSPFNNYGKPGSAEKDNGDRHESNGITAGGPAGNGQFGGQWS